jgi:3-deoxy-D-manno-octulosonate 8-phosphate phosphatase (KDO 8-P phosphatase)
MEGLGVPLEWLGVADKTIAFQELRQRYSVALEHIAYVADGREDVPILQAVGFPIVVADAHKSVRAVAKYVTQARGGDHALEEVIDLILEAHGWTS